MNIAIVGSRDFNNYEYMKEKFLLIKEDINEKIIIVSGGARGADSLAEKLAKELGFETIIFPANWKLGKGAGFIRNTTIVNNADIILAFPIGSSKGTYDTIKKGHQKGIPVYIY